VSHSTSTSAPQINHYNRFFEYARVITEVVVTDEGVYQKGQVPDTYGGAQLKLNVVWCVFMVNARAEMTVWEFELEYPMDNQKRKGGPLVRNGIEVRAQVGASDVPVQQLYVFNTNLDVTRKALGDAAFEDFKSELALQPGQPKS
jgi:hypothetical protein